MKLLSSSSCTFSNSQCWLCCLEIEKDQTSLFFRSQICPLNQVPEFILATERMCYQCKTIPFERVCLFGGLECKRKLFDVIAIKNVELKLFSFYQFLIPLDRFFSICILFSMVIFYTFRLGMLIYYLKFEIDEDESSSLYEHLD